MQYLLFYYLAPSLHICRYCTELNYQLKNNIYLLIRKSKKNQNDSNRHWKLSSAQQFHWVWGNRNKSLNVLQNSNYTNNNGSSNYYQQWHPYHFMWVYKWRQAHKDRDQSDQSQIFLLRDQVERNYQPPSSSPHPLTASLEAQCPMYFLCEFHILHFV